MFKIGPKVHTQCCCCDSGCSCHASAPSHQHCSCCCEDSKPDKFEKTKVDKPSLKKALPLGAIAGLASAGLVVAASNVLSKMSKKSPLTTVVATGVGLGVASGVINGTLANAASKQAANEQQNKVLIG